MIKVSGVIAEYLKSRGIKHVFGIIGAANSHIFDSIEKLGYTEIICVHHEQAAAMAMQTYFRTSGKVTAALVTAGGGSSNAITGVLSAWADSIPGVVISGQENSRFINSFHGMRMWGIQGYDSSGMVSSVTKYASRVMDPKECLFELEKSFSISETGRFGPTWIDFPMDIQGASVEKAELRHFNKLEESNLKAEENFIDQVVSMLENAERPVFWLGHGIRLAGAEKKIKQLLDICPVPTILTWAGMDMLSDECPLNFGRAGIYGNRAANFIVQNADLVVAIGNRLAIPMIGYEHNEFARMAKVIQVDIDDQELNKTKDIADLLIKCDASVFLNKLIKRLEADGLKYKGMESWFSKCNQYKNDFPLIDNEHKDTNGFINPYQFINRYSKELFKSDQLVVTDMGTALLSGHQAIQLKDGQRIMTSTGLGEMGYGLPGAIGASFARDKGEVLCLNCDGGMMMNLQELQTIRHHNLPIKIIVFNNDGYLMIKHTQKNLFKGKYVGSDKKSGVTCPDFAKVAAAFDIPYVLIKTWEDFSAVIPKVQAEKGPIICDVFMDPEQFFYPKLSVAVSPCGKLVSPPLEDMSPLLSREQLKNAMVIPVHQKSIDLG